MCVCTSIVSLFCHNTRRPRTNDHKTFNFPRYVRYACVVRDFRDKNTFTPENIMHSVSGKISKTKRVIALLAKGELNSRA